MSRPRYPAATVRDPDEVDRRGYEPLRPRSGSRARLGLDCAALAPSRPGARTIDVERSS